MGDFPRPPCIHQEKLWTKTNIKPRRGVHTVHTRYPQHVCLTALNNIHRVHAELRRHISEHFTEPGDRNWQQIS